MTRPTMGNLFSGSGTWELAARLFGIDVVFEAEIEPFPVELEAKRFPEAIQLGDVTKINGADIPVVDILTNSSPCQNLSVAGNREGLAGSESRLFTEAIRITKEMRNAQKEKFDSGAIESIRPRFWCLENVPGMFSSNKGQDFRTVIEEIGRIVDPSVSIPMPSNGKWLHVGLVDGKGWQVAWRELDSQYFGVPQRRKRVFIVADLRGHCAGQVLFEREGMSWDFAKIVEAWKDTSKGIAERIDLASRIVMGRVSDSDGDMAVRERERVQQMIVRMDR